VRRTGYPRDLRTHGGVLTIPAHLFQRMKSRPFKHVGKETDTLFLKPRGTCEKLISCMLNKPFSWGHVPETFVCLRILRKAVLIPEISAHAGEVLAELASSENRKPKSV
jgi:hypothetical protein